MAKTRGYKVFIGIMSNPKLMPVTPEEITITYEGQNQTQTLITGEEINIIKPSKLEEIDADFRIPVNPNAYSSRAMYEPGKRYTAATFLSYFKNWKAWRKTTDPIYFVLIRDAQSGAAIGSVIKGTGGATNFDMAVPVTLESYTVEEHADHYGTVVIKTRWKRYKAYGTTSVKIKKAPAATLNSASTSNKSTPTTQTKATTTTQTAKKDAGGTKYTIVSGDTLPRISQKAYGTSSRWQQIYQANAATIEAAARAHGKGSSDGGHWIWPGTVLTLPA